MRITNEQRRANWMFLAPALFLYLVWTVIPTLRGLYYSFTEFDGLSAPVWVGWENFIALSHDTQLFLVAIRNNLILTFVPGFLIVSLSLFFASLLQRDLRGSGFFRTVFYLPNTFSLVTVSLLFTLLYSTSGFGVLNGILKFYGAQEPFPFTISKYVIWACIPVILWGAIGFNTLLYVAAMRRIPETYYEAVKIDGGSAWHAFRHVTVPFIWEILVTTFVFALIGGLQIFAPIWLLEGQTTRPESNTVATLMYGSIMSEYRVGYGTAIGVVLFAVTLVVILATKRMTQKEALEY